MKKDEKVLEKRKCSRVRSVKTLVAATLGFKKIYSGGFGRLLKSKRRKLDFHTKSERKCTQRRTLVPVLFAKEDA